ncbi:MAG: F0F1 ATP synthase subunit delta [Patescibacteria group bacterium]
MKRYSKSELAKAYLTLSRSESPKVAVRALAAALVTARLTHEVEIVVREISRQLLKQGVVMAEVITAHDLSQELTSSIETLLRNLGGGKELRATYAQDKNIIGGFIAKLPTHEVDASVASTLRRISLPTSA